MLESAISRDFVARFNALVGCRARKRWAQQGQRGQLDVEAIFWGVSLEIETKRPGKMHMLTELQQIEIGQIREVGGIAGPASEWPEVLAILRANKKLLIAAYKAMSPSLVVRLRAPFLRRSRERRLRVEALSASPRPTR